jgi:metal-responsive CopG/Arc/MetJ family transcriptional regulator
MNEMPRPEPVAPDDRAKSTTRASVSFPSDVYDELERIAAAKKVSLAWVVRDAAEKYVADQWPLLEQSKGQRS